MTQVRNVLKSLDATFPARITSLLVMRLAEKRGRTVERKFNKAYASIAVFVAAYKLDFNDLLEEAAVLIAREATFFNKPYQQASRELDMDWMAFIERIIRRMEDADMTLAYEPDRQRLTEFVNENTIYRASLIRT